MVLLRTDLTSEAEVLTYLHKGNRLLFLHGPRCAPCLRLKPALLADLEALPQPVSLGMIDAQAHPELRRAYGSPKIPYLIVFERVDSPIPEDCKFAQTDGLQHSDIGRVRAFLNTHLNLGIPEPFSTDVDF